MFNYMISDIILLCALTAELTQSSTHGTCVRGYTHLRQSHCALALCLLFAAFLSMLSPSVIFAAAAADIPPTREMMFDQPLGTVSQRAPPTWK